MAELKAFLGLVGVGDVLEHPVLQRHHVSEPLYQILTRFLHFSNNQSHEADRLYKVKPFLDFLMGKFQELYTPHANICIDEGI